MSDNTGGPAFPVDWETFNRSNGKPACISVRDYFAAKAMQEFVADLDPRLAADMAYQYADAMLRERAK